MKKESDIEEDRISELPNEILNHILCFLETRQIVQTSVLSKRWRNLWTSVPVLRFLESRSFRKRTSYKNFVHNVLRKRDPNSNVEYLTLDHTDYDEDILEAVVDYAASHGVIHFDFPSFYIHYRVFHHEIFTQCKTLKILQLENFEFEGSFSLTTLTSLRLALCRSFCYELPGCFDFMSYFPNLKNLELRDGKFRDFVVKISSPKLLQLTIVHRVGAVQIDAPNLTYLKCKIWIVPSVSLINLTSLQLSAIDPIPVLSYDSVFKFFKSLHNVQSLYLSDRAVKVEYPDLDGEPTPFTRLKKWCFDHRFDEIPTNVSAYLICGKFEFMS